MDRSSTAAGAMALPAQFTFSNTSASALCISASRVGDPSPAGLDLAPLASRSKFVTRRSPMAAKLAAPMARRVLPMHSKFASISMSLAAATQPLFASVTASKAKPAAKPAAGKEAPKKKRSLGEVLSYAGQKALSGGIPGLAAMAIQVLALMWLRTTMNYQYRYGGSLGSALKTLYADGGIPRFYQGLLPALIQGPLSRFGDTAANTGVLALLEDAPVAPAIKTVAASVGAGLFRICLMPVDAVKTIMQVEGAKGLPSLAAKISKGGPTVLFHGALAASAATFVGHYPWFAMYNTLDAALPRYKDDLPKKLLRSAFIGWCSSLVSDVCSNSIRVVKTARQTATVPMGYGQVIKMIVEKDGLSGLFIRGLGTKLISNGIQGIMFSVLWRLGQDYMEKEAKAKAAKEAAAAKDPKAKDPKAKK